jgi:hypothetical protein
MHIKCQSGEEGTVGETYDRRKDNINMGLEELGCDGVDWIELDH